MSQEEPPARLITLPSNVSICSGPGGPALLRARVFTRLATTAPNAATLAAALAGGESVAAFCHQHDKAVLIFDEDDDNYDTHSEHFRAVCLRLKAHGDIGLELAACIFEAPSDLLAGFQLESMKGGDVLVVDLHDERDDSDDDDHHHHDDDHDDNNNSNNTNNNNTNNNNTNNNNTNNNNTNNNNTNNNNTNNNNTNNNNTNNNNNNKTSS